MSKVYLLVLASEFNLPRLSIDLHPGTLAFVIFCTTLLLGLLAGLVTLGLYSERRKRESAHHSQWVDDAPTSVGDRSDAADEAGDRSEGEDVEPFIPDTAKPDVSDSVHDLFDVDEDAGGVKETQ